VQLSQAPAAVLGWDELGDSQVLALMDRQRTRLAFGVLLVAALALALAGCSSQIADLNPADPQIHKEPVGYLPVHDLPPAREEAVISPEQRAKIEAELQTARDHQAAAAKDSGAK
jgi:hypothetical protein